jgi:hypothetical protein
VQTTIATPAEKKRSRKKNGLEESAHRAFSSFSEKEDCSLR